MDLDTYLGEFRGFRNTSYPLSELIKNAKNIMEYLKTEDEVAKEPPEPKRKKPTFDAK